MRITEITSSSIKSASPSTRASKNSACSSNGDLLPPRALALQRPVWRTHFTQASKVRLIKISCSSAIATCCMQKPGGGTSKALLHGDRSRREAFNERVRQLQLDGLRKELEEMTSRVRTLIKQQTRARIFRGNTRSEGKLLSPFEPSTEIIRNARPANPTRDVGVLRGPAGGRRSNLPFNWRRRALEGCLQAVQADEDVVGAVSVSWNDGCASWSACSAGRQGSRDSQGSARRRAAKNRPCSGHMERPQGRFAVRAVAHTLTVARWNLIERVSRRARVPAR